MAPGSQRLWVAVFVAAFVVFASSLAAAGLTSSNATAAAAVGATTTLPATIPAASSSTTTSLHTSPSEGLGVNGVLANAVAQKEQTIVKDGGSLANFHPPNLHQAPPLSSTHGVVIPLYSVAPAPLGVAYYGVNNTTANGGPEGTTVDTVSLAGSWSTSDPIGTAAELYDTSSGNAAGEFGAQENAVLTNVTIDGQTSFGANPNAPSGCPGFSSCPNEFWLQNYIEYTESTHALQIGDEIWNFSNPTADWASTQSSGTHTIVGFGSVQEGELYALSGSGYAFTVTVAPPFSLVLYMNYTQGPCHTDSTAGTGVPSCGSVSTTYPENELFMNYTIIKGGSRVCPSPEPSGRVCGEYDDVFFNSVGPGAPTGVPATGPNGQVGSAGIQANGTGYDPVGLTNDYEMDYGIGSDDGATNNIVYSNGVVGIDYCQNSNAIQTSSGAITCSSYSAPPAAMDFGGETGETSTGEMAYWNANGALNPGIPGTSGPVVHLETGPSLLIGLWNESGNTFPVGAGGEPLSYQNIAPANAWIGIAQGASRTNQSLFQVAPTFGWYSYWKGSGGATSPTTLGANLYLPVGIYTVEVLLSGYTPYIGNVNLLTSGQAPSITLSPNPSTGVYTPLWAFSNSDLANISVNQGSFGLGQIGNPYELFSAAPTVGAPYGETGSLSWLFSNLNDYLFTVWIGEFINTTTAYAESNPVPSFTMNYPTWQDSALGQFDVPTTDQFQIYLFHVQNFTLAGGTHIYAWANSEAATLYSVICNTCKNVLVADNTFAVSNEGIQFTGGGTNATPLVGNQLPLTRNVVWGNNFESDSQPTYSGLDTPSVFVAFSTEAFDRVYNNEFGNVSAGRSSALISGISASNEDWLNATCQAGYAPLGSATYPGSTPCEPLSYSQTINGFTLTGSIVGSTYQGGNYWSTYGTEINPYGNLPFLARTTSPFSGGISDSHAGAKGDYAPLITYSVYDPNFAETGISSSTSASAFETRVIGTGVTWVNETQTTTPTATCGGDPCLDFYVPSGSYTYYGLSGLTGSTAAAANPATGSFSVSGAPVGLVTTFAFALSHPVTFTETGLPSATHWSVSIPGQPTTISNTTTVVFNLPNAAYTYTVGAVAGYVTTNPSGGFSVTGSAFGESVPFYATLTQPGAPAVSAVALDVDQTLVVSGSIPTTGAPTYSWSWLVSVNGGSFGATSLCAINGGGGASSGALETCTIAGNSLSAGSSYAFELMVTDSLAESQTSAASRTVVVASQLAAPNAPGVSAMSLDSDQTLTVSGTIPTTGTATYAWSWAVSVNGGSDGPATECAVASGSGAAAGAPIACVIAGGSLAGGSTYVFELTVSDSATVAETQTSAPSPTVSVAGTLGAPGQPTVSATSLDVDQTLTVAGAIPTSGTPTFAWTWLVSVNGGGYSAATICATNGGTGASAGDPESCVVSGGGLSVGGTYAFELAVSDSASVSEMQTSPASTTVTVASALTAPTAPGVTATLLDVDQTLTASATLPTTGTVPYSYSWLVSVNGGAFVLSGICAVNSGVGGSGAGESCAVAANSLTVGDTYAFEIAVTDSASNAESAMSGSSSTVSVASALTAPAAPTVGASSLDADQALAVSGSIPATGTAPLSWSWLVSFDGGAYATATVCSVNGGVGSGAVSCSISGGTLSAGAYAFELTVTDSATFAETQTSGASGTVSVSSALSQPTTPTVSATALDVDQALTVGGQTPTTGTVPYSWSWLVSVNGGSLMAATMCATPSGNGAGSGASETCSVSGGSLSVGSMYAFALQTTDSATIPETQTSGGSSVVTVASMLTAPSTPTANRPALDVNQALTVTATVPTTGTGPYTYSWLVSVNGGGYGLATQCAPDSGSGAIGGSTATCSVAGNTLTVGNSYVFELSVTDSASAAESTTSAPSGAVTVASLLVAPAAPTVSGNPIDVNQDLHVKGITPTTGTAPYTWDWIVSVDSGTYSLATMCAVDQGTGAAGGVTETCTIVGNTLTVGNHYRFELQVSDAATSGEARSSPASANVAVHAELTAPVKPTVSSTRLVVSQTLTVSAKLQSTGSATYAWEFLVSVNGGAFVQATMCSVSNGTGAAGGATVTCTVAGGALTVGDTYAFEVKVTDSATNPESKTSGASKTVTVVA